MSLISYPRPMHQKKKNTLQLFFLAKRERKQLLLSDTELRVILIFQFSHSIKEAIICSVLITKFLLVSLLENFVGFNYHSVYAAHPYCDLKSTKVLVCIHDRTGFYEKHDLAFITNVFRGLSYFCLSNIE